MSKEKLFSDRELDAMEEGGLEIYQILDRIFAMPGDKLWRRCVFNPVSRWDPISNEEVDLSCHREATQRFETDGWSAWCCEEHYEALLNTMLIAKMSKP